ncbi:MAG TPA: DUF6044 family protein [Acidimicrobiales bacterium]|jgi:hypothetical protein
MSTDGPGPTMARAVPVERTGVRRIWAAVPGWARRHPGMVVLLLVPLVVFGVPQLSGSTFLDGDNLLQNFPMRVLVGRDLQHHVLPLWNPYLFSGTPLLGGFNAGAAYPTTWLFALLPRFTAWTLNLALAYDLALAGMYVFLRRQPIGSPAATMAAATFALSGYMSAQIVHIDLVAGAAWLPWMLVAVHALTRPAALGPRRTRGWVGLLGLAIGMSILTGGAEAVIDSGVLVAVYLAARLVGGGHFHRVHRRALAFAVGAVALAVAAGVALGAAQWVPGLAFEAQSQRSAANYGFFSTGSLPARALGLVATPFLLGTNHNPGYAGPYNFQEVTSYVGILALIAAGSLFLRKWRRRPEARHWRVWYVVLALGLLSALGAETPFGHVLFLIPGVDHERLLNRNLLLVDFALAALLGWWLHLLLLDPGGGGGATGAGDPVPPLRRRWAPGRRAELVATCAPLAVIAGMGLFLWVDGQQLQSLMQIQFPVDATARFQDAALVTLGGVIAAAATWVVLAAPRLPRVRLRRLLALVLAADLIWFNAFVVHPPVTQSLAQASGELAAELTATVGDGRFIIYNPDEFYDSQLYELGQTDLNIFNHLGSGQGYTALTDAAYYRATGAHYQEDLDPATLAGPTWDTLNVRTLLSLPSYFVTPVTPAGVGIAPAPGLSTPFPPDLTQYNSSPTPAPAPVTLAPGQSHRWYFGGVLTVDRWAVRALGPSPALRVGMLTPTGAVRWLPATDAATGPDGSVRVTPAAPVGSAGLIVENRSPNPEAIGIPTARTAQAGEVALNGRMQYGVNLPRWRFTGTIGAFGVFQNTEPHGWARARARGGGPPPPGTTVTASAPGPAGGGEIVVHAPSAVTLERSVAWSPGWRATIRPVGVQAAPVSQVAVARDGVIQTVGLPRAGDYRVTFTYSPAPAAAGLVVSAAAAAAALLWGAMEWLGAARRRRRRRASGTGRPAQPGASRPTAPAARR